MQQIIHTVTKKIIYKDLKDSISKKHAYSGSLIKFSISYFNKALFNNARSAWACTYFLSQSLKKKTMNS